MRDRRISAINRTLVSGREILTPLLSPVQLLSYYHVLHDSHRLRQTQYTLGHSKNTSWRMTVTYQSSINYQPKQYTFIRELPQNYHIFKFALFDPPEMDNNDPCILQVKYPGYTIWRKLNPQVSSCFFFACCNMFESLPSLKLTVRTWNAGVGSDEFPFGAGPPGRRYVSFGECNQLQSFYLLILHFQPVIWHKLMHNVTSGSFQPKRQSFETWHAILLLESQVRMNKKKHHFLEENLKRVYFRETLDFMNLFCGEVLVGGGSLAHLKSGHLRT